MADTYEEQQGGWCGWKEKVRGKGEAMRWRGSRPAGIGRGVSSGEESQCHRQLPHIHARPLRPLSNAPTQGPVIEAGAEE